MQPAEASERREAAREAVPEEPAAVQAAWRHIAAAEAAEVPRQTPWAAAEAAWPPTWAVLRGLAAAEAVQVVPCRAAPCQAAPYRADPYRAAPCRAVREAAEA